MIVHKEWPLFHDRVDAGKRLAEKLIQYEDSETVVLAVPCGGVPVAIEVAAKLGGALDIVIPRKLTIPYNPEAGYGAVTEDGSIVLNEPLVQRLGLTEPEISHQAEKVRAGIARRIAEYRKKLPVSKVEGKTAIVVDDGLASGFTMLAAIRSIQRRKVEKVVVAVPVASATAHDLVKPLADELVCLVIARIHQFAVASFYHHWYDLTDEEVFKYFEEWQMRQTF
jgi:predicted phosphoribosyltransferase